MVQLQDKMKTVDYVKAQVVSHVSCEYKSWRYSRADRASL